MGGNYIEFNINRDEIARYGLALGDVQEVLRGGPWRNAAYYHRRRVGALQRKPALRPRFSGKS